MASKTPAAEKPQPSKRGAKPLAAAEAVGPQIDAEKLPERNQELVAMSDIQAGYGQDRDLVNQLLGQVQMADAFGKFSVTVTSSKLAFVKENKLYKALAGQKSRNGYDFSGTWEEFCGQLGISVEKADLDIKNLRQFGEEAVEAMSRMGIGYREMRQYRQLPDDSRNALAELAKTGDKEAVLDLAEELITRQAKENEKLADKVEKTKAEYEALSQNLAKTNDALDKAKAKATLLPRMKADKKANEMLAELERDFLDTRANLQQVIKGMETLVAHTTAHELNYDEDISALTNSLVNQCLGLLALLRAADIEGPAKHALDVLKAG